MGTTVVPKKKFWEEVIAYFPLTIARMSETTGGKKILVCTRNEVNKTLHFGKLQCWYY
jgi:hypothetical protein